MSSSRSAAPAEDEHKGDTGSGTGIAGPVDHRASSDIVVLAEDVGSRSESGTQGSASESRLSQPVRTTSPEDVIAQAHDQRKGPGDAGMLGKYATHTDTIATSFSFNSATIGSERDSGSAPDSQMLRRGEGSKHQGKRSTTKVQTSRSTKRKTRENEERGPERDQEPASSAGVLSEQASSEEATTTTSTATSPHCALEWAMTSQCSEGNQPSLWKPKKPNSVGGGQKSILCDGGVPSGCTQEKCCDGRCDASLCVGDQKPKDDAADVRCTGRLCAADDCCVCKEEPYCANNGYSLSKDCREGDEPSSFWTLKKPHRQASICCSGSPCTQEECCDGMCHESLCVGDQKPKDDAADVRCTGRLCAADDCCVCKEEPHCAKSQWGTSPQCSAGSPGLWKVKKPWKQASICCSGDTCTREECCDGQCDVSLCVGDQKPKDDAADVRCTGRLCAADDCCVCKEEPYCAKNGYSFSKDCREGDEPSSFWTVKKPHRQASICCSGSPCTQEECCDGMCHESLCVGDQKPKDAAEDVRCPGKLCGADDCCVFSNCAVALDTNEMQPLCRAIRVVMDIPPGRLLGAYNPEMTTYDALVGNSTFLETAAATYAEYLSAEMSPRCLTGTSVTLVEYMNATDTLAEIASSMTASVESIADVTVAERVTIQIIATINVPTLLHPLAEDAWPVKVDGQEIMDVPGAPLNMLQLNLAHPFPFFASPFPFSVTNIIQNIDYFNDNDNYSRTTTVPTPSGPTPQGPTPQGPTPQGSTDGTNATGFRVVVEQARADADAPVSSAGGGDTTLYIVAGVAVLAVCAAIAAFALQPVTSQGPAARPSDGFSSSEGNSEEELDEDDDEDNGGGKTKNKKPQNQKTMKTEGSVRTGGSSMTAASGSVALGQSKAFGGGSVALGQGSMAAGAGGSMAIGGGSMAAGQGSMAAGAGGSMAIGGGSMAAGQGSMAAKAGGSMAIGGRSIAAGQGSVAAKAGGSMAIGGRSMAH